LEFRWGLALAVGVYALLGGTLILQNPGLEYDEALQVLGAVHMRNSPGEITLPHDPDTWLCAAGRCLPLMTVRYAGAVKEYLCLPLFTLFGTRVEVVRLVSLLLGGVGIFGMGWLLARHVAPCVGIATALILAIHPAYVDLTVFDNGTISVWMAALGLTALAISRYVSRQDATGAFLIGAALGFGVWARANFVWMVAAVFVAAILVLRKRLLQPWRHWAAFAAGGIAGALPLLTYQVISRGGTFEALDMFRVSTGLGDLVTQRLPMLAEMLLSDGEHRAIWNGPALPEWQMWFFPCVVLASCVVCLVSSAWARGLAIAFLALVAFTMSSRMPVAQHHLIALVPLAAAMAAMAGWLLAKKSRAAAIALAAIYGIAALDWQVAAIRGIRDTGGVGQWSDSVFELSEHLRTGYAGSLIRILDWGLQNNLYVLSDGQLKSREVFPGTREVNRLGRPWREDVARGGVFVMNGPRNRHFPDPTEGFLDALAKSGAKAKGSQIKQQNGEVYAEIVDVPPAVQSAFSLGAPEAASQIEGFHQVEDGGWRWSKQAFTVTLVRPRTAGAYRLKIEVFVPPATIEKFGRQTLSAKIGQTALPPQTFSKSGNYVFERTIDVDTLETGRLRIDFSLDKAFAPTPADARERGIIVRRVSLEPR
jgi:hypothetical protein